jgi:hypothetical protein
MNITDHIQDLVLKAKGKKWSRILILKDNILVHNDIMNELGLQLPIMKDSKVLYLGGSLIKTKNSNQLDPQFYVDTYQDLEEIDTVEKAQKHWKMKGHREGRWGSRHVAHPDLISDLSAISIHEDVYDLYTKSVNGKKGPPGFKAFEKAAAKTCYAMIPPPFMNELTKMNRTKNRANAGLYN